MTVRIDLPRRLASSIDWICSHAHPLETGGVVVGRYRDSERVEVQGLLPPPPDSKATRNTFVRGRAGLEEEMTRIWPASYYVGEWHYHPNQTTVEASPMDFTAMLGIANDPDAHCPCPIMLIFGEPGRWSRRRTVRAWVVIEGEIVEVNL